MEIRPSGVGLTSALISPKDFGPRLDELRREWPPIVSVIASDRASSNDDGLWLECVDLRTALDSDFPVLVRSEHLKNARGHDAARAVEHDLLQVEETALRVAAQEDARLHQSLREWALYYGESSDSDIAEEFFRADVMEHLTDDEAISGLIADTNTGAWTCDGWDIVAINEEIDEEGRDQLRVEVDVHLDGEIDDVRPFTGSEITTVVSFIVFWSPQGWMFDRFEVLKVDIVDYDEDREPDDDDGVDNFGPQDLED